MAIAVEDNGMPSRAKLSHTRDCPESDQGRFFLEPRFWFLRNFSLTEHMGLRYPGLGSRALIGEAVTVYLIEVSKANFAFFTRYYR